MRPRRLARLGHRPFKAAAWVQVPSGALFLSFWYNILVRFTTYTRYAIRALLHLSEDQPKSLREISQKERIPERFLEQVFLKLKRAGLVRGKRGARGGYVLARPKGKISWYDVMEAVGEGISPVPCLGKNPEHCPTYNECLVRKYWDEYYRLTREFFTKLTLDIK